MQLSAAELERAVITETEDNPALELAYVGEWPDQGTLPWAEPDLARTASRPPVLEELEGELRLLAEGRCLAAAIYLLYSLDSRGYLTLPLEELAAEMGASTELARHGLEVLQQLDPPGIGARDLRECLLIQCRRLQEDGVDCEPARLMIAEAWEDFACLRWEVVARRLSLSAEAVDASRAFVARNLYPHPLHLIHSDRRDRTMGQPDLVVTRKTDHKPGYGIHIPAAEAWGLRISESFLALEPWSPIAALTRPEGDWVRSHVERARVFINALNQRWNTLRLTGEYLVEYQRAFLDEGPSKLRPLTRAAVASSLGVHESTMSRVVNQKTVRLPGGQTVALSLFFESALPVKEAIGRVIGGSTRRLSDREIAERLQSRGFNLARRTVAKYRRDLQPVPLLAR